MPLRVQPRRDRKLNRLVKAAPVVTARRGERLLAPGDAAADVLLVREGHLRIVDPEWRGAGGERTVAVAGPWEVAGEEALVEGRRGRLGIVAGEATRLQRLPGSAVAGVLRSSPATFAARERALLADLRLARRLATGAAALSTAERLTMVLLDLYARMVEPAADAPGGAVPPEAPARRLPFRPTHRTLADLAGAHRSTVTTLLNDWLYEEVLALDGRRLVLLRPRRLPSGLVPGGPAAD